MTVKVTDYNDDLSGEYTKSRKLKKCEDALFECAEKEGLVVSYVAAKYGTSADGSASKSYAFSRFSGGELGLPSAAPKAFSVGLTIAMSGAVHYLVGYTGAAELAAGLHSLDGTFDAPYAFQQIEQLLKRWDAYPTEDLLDLFILLTHVYETLPEARSFIDACGGLPCHP